MNGWIQIKGARQNNLKGFDLALPRDQLVVITGPSGSGKSSLAFDTLYAEGQRRYVESLSPGARLFLKQMAKPDVDAIEGLSPAVAVEQRPPGGGPRATVATASDVYDYLRLLYTRLGQAHCYQCGQPMGGHTVQAMVDEVLTGWAGERLLVLAPLPYHAGLELAAFMEPHRRGGFVRALADGQMWLLEAPPPVAQPQRLELVVDRLSLETPDRQRLTEAVELAAQHGQGLVAFASPDGGATRRQAYSTTPRCAACAITYPAPHPRLFSYNSPHGACPECQGLGVRRTAEEALVVPDGAKSLSQGALAPWGGANQEAYQGLLERLADHYGFSLLTPFEKLSPLHRQAILYGSGEEVLEFTYQAGATRHHFKKVWEGVIPGLERRYRKAESPARREALAPFVRAQLCPACQGGRLRRESLHVLLGGLSIAALCGQSLPQMHQWLKSLTPPPGLAGAVAPVMEQVERRLAFMISLGLGYLSADRTLDTLSGGEAQRIRLATHLGSGLSGVLYLLDEPTIGLHQRDTGKLLAALERLRQLGNSVVVVEHDRECMEQAGFLVEIGPAAGEAGGYLVAAGTPQQVRQNPNSATGAYLSGKRAVALPAKRRAATAKKLRLVGASTHNLKGLTLDIPLGLLVGVAGVSGSGKSSLVLDTLYPALLQQLDGHPATGLGLEKLEGAHLLERVIHVDQSAIGRSARSNPATFMGLFSQVRKLFALTPQARQRGYGAERFSFNVAGGRCQSCQGEGRQRIEMHFLPDAYVVCDSCQGSRFNRETLEIRYRGKNIAEVLELTVSQAFGFFSAQTLITPPLAALQAVGLGYLKLGQPANTLSGGEAQRLKIARELAKKEAGRTLYVLDEPTLGLHFEDVARLLAVLDGLVDKGNSVVVIEHNLELLKYADQLIELGPEAGPEGGNLVAQGTPEELAAHPGSVIGPFLKPFLG